LFLEWEKRKNLVSLQRIEKGSLGYTARSVGTEHQIWYAHTYTHTHHTHTHTHTHTHHTHITHTHTHTDTTLLLQ